MIFESVIVALSLSFVLSMIGNVLDDRLAEIRRQLERIADHLERKDQP